MRANAVFDFIYEYLHTHLCTTRHLIIYEYIHIYNVYNVTYVLFIYLRS